MSTAGALLCITEGARDGGPQCASKRTSTSRPMYAGTQTGEHPEREHSGSGREELAYPSTGRYSVRSVRSPS
eukprot:3425557-Alexandrium_andersonii.AAC.1